MEKNCKSCGQTKPITEFYTHSEMKDGHLSICKPCQRAVTSKARRANLEYYREYDRERSKDPERMKRATLHTKKRRASLIGYASAHKKVQLAVERGQLIRKPCEMCGTKDYVHAHHDDYSKPLDVIWLCPIHHKARHAYLDSL